MPRFAKGLAVGLATGAGFGYAFISPSSPISLFNNPTTEEQFRDIKALIYDIRDIKARIQQHNLETLANTSGENRPEVIPSLDNIELQTKTISILDLIAEERVPIAVFSGIDYNQDGKWDAFGIFSTISRPDYFPDMDTIKDKIILDNYPRETIVHLTKNIPYDILLNETQREDIRVEANKEYYSQITSPFIEGREGVDFYIRREFKDTYDSSEEIRKSMEEAGLKGPFRTMTEAEAEALDTQGKKYLLPAEHFIAAVESGRAGIVLDAISTNYPNWNNYKEEKVKEIQK